MAALQPPDFFDGATPLTYVLIRILRALLAGQSSWKIPARYTPVRMARKQAGNNPRPDGTEMDFNSWLTNQGIDPNVFPDKERVREVYEQAQLRGEAPQATTLGPGTTGGHGYAVAIEDGADLRVTLWVKRCFGRCSISSAFATLTWCVPAAASRSISARCGSKIIWRSTRRRSRPWRRCD